MTLNYVRTVSDLKLSPSEKESKLRDQLAKNSFEIVKVSLELQEARDYIKFLENKLADIQKIVTKKEEY